MALIFEWDDKKAKSNLQKHGISFEEASTVFGDDLSITIDDPLHSESENRCIIIGQSINQKLLVVVHIEKTDSIIRIISARKATKKERKFYEEL